MSEKLDIPSCTEKFNVIFPCSKMDNGERRFRLLKNKENGGYGYNLTEMPANIGGCWQKSHYHKGMRELYAVQIGWIGFSKLHHSGIVDIEVYYEGDFFVIEPGLVHNVFMPAGAVIHTIKMGNCLIPWDWFASEELDKHISHLTAAEILKLGNKPMEL